MTIRDFIITGWHDGRTMVARHRILVLTIVVMFAVAGSSRFLRGDILGTGGSGGLGSSSSSEQSLRACDSKDTRFEDVQNIDELRNIYRQGMTAVVSERETILKTPSLWKCGVGAAGEPPIPVLRALAADLPGWHYRVDTSFLFGAVTVPVQRPVTFASFASIVAEFQREYECKLSEIQDRSLAEVALNNDIEKPAQFCCVTVGDSQGCREQSDASMCDTPLTSSPTCNDQCNVLLYMSDLARRLPALQENALVEREISRVAMERMLNTMRSFDVNYAVARQFVCYQRASLDLKNEMSLLADAVSCMPKIWDAVTSIHDKKQ